MTSGSSFHRVLWDGMRVCPMPIWRMGAARIESAERYSPRGLVFGQGLFRLAGKMRAENIDDVYLMRVEQLYPVPHGPLLAELEPMAHAEMVWCQEEPRNMGAWSFIEPELEDVLTTLGAKHKRVSYAGAARLGLDRERFDEPPFEQREALLNAALIDPIDR